MGQWIYNYLIVFLTGMLGIWKAVPVGLALTVDPIWIWLLTSLGATLSVIILFFFGDRIRKYVYKRRTERKKTKKETRLKRLFDSYGAPGLGFFGCLLMGPNMTIILGMIIVRSQRKLLFWTLAGIVVWTFVLTLIGVFSIELFEEVRRWLTL